MSAMDDSEWDKPLPRERHSAMRIEVYQDRAELWRWRLVAANGKTVADSGEGYSRKRDALRAVRTFRGLAWRAPVIEIDAIDQSRIDARLASLRSA